jgi:hypothetical protein
MKITRAKGFILGCGILLCGCDPEFRLAGRVTMPNGHAVSGAKLWLQCYDGGKDFATTANEAGRFESRGIGWRSSACTIRAQAPGYSDASIPIMSVCRRRPSHLKDACLEVAPDPLVLNPTEP